MYRVELGVEYHTQDDVRSCGADVAMMILHHLGERSIQQDVLYREMNAVSPKGWSVAPEALAYGLNRFAPAAHAGTFRAAFCSDERAFAEMLVGALSVRDAAPVAVLRDCSHWLLVSAYESDVDPRTDAGYAILGFFVNTPTLAIRRTPPPPPHWENDGCEAHANGGSNQFVRYERWKAILGGCPDFGAAPFAAICRGVAEPQREGPALKLERTVIRGVAS